MSTTTTSPHPTVCALCNNPPLIPCPSTCQDLLYCSAACQAADEPIHKHVCAAFASTSPTSLPPKPTDASSKHVLGVLFPADAPAPRLVWVPIGGFNDEESGISFQEAEVAGFFGSEEIQPEALHSERNRARNRDARSMLEIWHVPAAGASKLELKENECIKHLASVGSSSVADDEEGGKPFHDWRGAVLVLFMTRSTGFMVDPGAYRDCEVQDFRDAVDFVVDYGNEGHERRLREVLERLGRDEGGGERVEEVVGGGEEVEEGEGHGSDGEKSVEGSGKDGEQPEDLAGGERSKSPMPTSFVIEMEG